jgi:WD40 repeat protein
VVGRWASLVIGGASGDTGQIAILNAGGEVVGRPSGAGASPSFSPSGRRIAYVAKDGSTRTIRANGTKQRRLLGPGVAAPEYSPVGERIVVAGKPPGRSRGGIWTMHTDGSQLRSLDANPRDGFPDYSPNGRNIVFLRLAGGGAHCCNQLFTMRSDGSQLRRVPGIGELGDDVDTAAYAPAGGRIAVGIISGDYLFGECEDLYTMSPTGSDVQRVTHGCDVTGHGPSSGGPSWQPIPTSP